MNRYVRSVAAVVGFALLVCSVVSIAQPVRTGGGLSRVTVDGSGGLEGSGTTTNPLTLRQDCANGFGVAWDGDSWECSAIGGSPGTGTTNTVTKWTGASTLGDSSIADDGTTVQTALPVGIAIAPAAQLHVLKGDTPGGGPGLGLPGGCFAGEVGALARVNRETVDTTAGCAIDVALAGHATSAKSAGANDLTNIAVFGAASSGDVNYAGYFGAGDVKIENALTVDGNTTVGNFRGTVISPTGLTGTLNDWAPTGIATATTINAATSGTTTITGITGGAEGRKLTIYSDAANNINFLHDNGGSTAANRLLLISATVMLPAGADCSLELTYTASRYRQTAFSCANYASSTAASPSMIFGNAGRGWYVNNNELNQGHNSAISDTGFINYSGHAGGTTQFRSTWIGNGKNAAAPILYVNGTNNRVGINTASPAQSLHVAGTGHVTGDVTLGANLTNNTAAGIFQWGPLGGGGGFLVNRSTGAAGFIPFTDTANPWGMGFGTTSSVVALIDMKSMTFEPGTSNPRIDNNVTLINGLATSQYDTTAGDLFITDFFLDSSHIKQAGANALNNVLMRLDANGPLQGGGVRHATALWIDKGEFRNSGHTTYAVRPSTGAGPTAPPVISACGTTPTRTGNDNGGRITVGSGSPTSCTLTFQLAWVDHTASAITPVCLVVNKEGVATGLSWTESSTTLVISWTGGSPTTLSWHCFGLDDAVPGP